MGSMLVNDIKIILKLYQPVGIKQLSDQSVAASGFRSKAVLRTVPAVLAVPVPAI